MQVERLAPAASGAKGDAPWVVLDGAHTPGSAGALAATLAGAFPGQPLAFVVANLVIFWSGWSTLEGLAAHLFGSGIEVLPTLLAETQCLRELACVCTA